MHRTPPPSDDSWESDAVWKLLDQNPPESARRGFADDLVRQVRLLEDEKPWWSRFFSPAPLAGLAAATAACAFAFMVMVNPAPSSGNPVAVLDSPEAVAIQDIAETEALMAAADQLEDFSDTELVSLIGF